MPELLDGQSVEMQGSGAKPYVLKNTGGVYSCTCPPGATSRSPSNAAPASTSASSAAMQPRTSGSGRRLPRRREPAAADGEAPAPPLLLAESWDNDAI